MKKHTIIDYEFYIFLIFIIIMFIAMILFSNWRKNECIKNNGKVVEDSIGIMEKCIKGE